MDQRPTDVSDNFNGLYFRFLLELGWTLDMCAEHACDLDGCADDRWIHAWDNGWTKQ